MVSCLKRKTKIALVAIFCSILWGSAFPVLKISYSEMGIESDTFAKILLAGIRFFIAAIIILIILKIFIKEPLSVNKKDIGKLTILGFLQTAGYYFFFYIGLSNTSSMKGAILSSLENFLVVILAHYIYKNDKINNGKIIGLVLGFVGIIFANWGKQFNFDFRIDGEGFMILATFFGAFATILCKKLCSTISPFVASAYQMIIGSLMLIIIGIVFKGYSNMHFNSISFWLLIYSAILSSLAFSLWFRILKDNKAGEIVMYKFIIPISGVILSAIFIKGESMNLNIIISLVLVSLGVYIVNKTSKN